MYTGVDGSRTHKRQHLSGLVADLLRELGIEEVEVIKVDLEGVMVEEEGGAQAVTLGLSASAITTGQ